MDFLNDFDPSSSSDDEDRLLNEKSHNYPPFSPNLHDKFWYRDASKENQTATAINEIDLYRVADFYESGNIEEAEKILTDLRENTKNNRTHEVMLIDSLLQCYIAKTQDLSPSETSLCLRLLADYESLLVDFGDQVQFLRTKALILSKSLEHSHHLQFRRTMALLCQLCASSENWLLFEKGAKCFNDVELYGLKAKMAKVLHYEMQHSRGFVKEKLERKWERVKKEEHALSEKLTPENMNLVLSSLASHKDITSPESATSSVFRAHDSRSKNKLIPIADQPAVISDFFARYQFLSFSFS